MTFVDWVRENLTMRVIMANCFINIGGQTYSAKIHNPEELRHITVEYTDDHNKEHKLLIYLSELTTFNGFMFTFEYSSPGMKEGTLVIPFVKLDDEDDDEEE